MAYWAPKSSSRSGRYFTIELLSQPLKISAHKVFLHLDSKINPYTTARFFVADSAMAFGVAAQHHLHHLFSIHANYCSSSYAHSCSNLHSPIHYRCSTKCANGYSSIRFRTAAKASANKNQSTIPEKPKLPVEDDDSDPEAYPDRNSFSSVMHRIR